MVTPTSPRSYGDAPQLRLTPPEVTLLPTCPILPGAQPSRRQPVAGGHTTGGITVTRSFRIKRTHHGPLDCEELSPRITPAITTDFTNGVLTITGDGNGNTITLT